MNAGSLTNITAETVHSQLKRLKLASLSSNLEEILSTASAAKMTPLEVLNYRCLSSHLSENLKKFPTLSDLTWIYALRRLTPENSLQLPSQCSAFRSPD